MTLIAKLPTAEAPPLGATVGVQIRSGTLHVAGLKSREVFLYFFLHLIGVSAAAV